MCADESKNPLRAGCSPFRLDFSHPHVKLRSRLNVVSRLMQYEHAEMVCFKFHRPAEHKITSLDSHLPSNIYEIRIVILRSQCGPNSHSNQHTAQSISHGFLWMTKERMTVFVRKNGSYFVVASSMGD